MKKRKALKRLQERIDGYEITISDKNVHAGGYKKPGSMQGNK